MKESDSLRKFSRKDGEESLEEWCRMVRQEGHYQEDCIVLMNSARVPALALEHTWLECSPRLT